MRFQILEAARFSMILHSSAPHSFDPPQNRDVGLRRVLLRLFVMAPVEAKAEDLSALFGSRVTANARFKAPFLTGDFDGDGTPDAAYLVTILPESAQDKLAEDVTVIGTVIRAGAAGRRAARRWRWLSSRRAAGRNSC